MAFWSFASMAAALSGSNDLITCPVAGLIVAIAMVGLPNATWPKCLGRSEGFVTENPNWSYQHTKSPPSLYSPSIDIHDSLNLIVDTLLLKVVQGSYLFTVYFAYLPLSAIGITIPKPRQLASHRSPSSRATVPARPNHRHIDRN